MDHYLTTYSKDYLWPFVPCQTGLRPSLPTPQSLVRCPCHCKRSPFAPLKDTHLYPAKVGAAPVTDTSRYDQPSAYLRKISDKYPYLYSVLQNAPPDDLIARVYRERLMSTYQLDYCKLGMFPSDDHIELMSAAGLGDPPPDINTVNIPGCYCRPQQYKSISFRPATISNSVKAPPSSREEGGGPSSVYVPPKTEYQDGISKMGAVIAQLKLHSRKTK